MAINATVSGALGHVAGVTLTDASNPSLSTVEGWIEGITGLISLKLHESRWDILDDAKRTYISAAAQHIIELYVAGDILDSSYHIDKESEQPGAGYRKAALDEMRELIPLVEAAIEMAESGINDDSGVGGVETVVALPHIRLAQRF